jgi:hypothetical protein
MVVIQLNGGLGNQMFQYAVARSLSIKCKSEVALDLRELSNCNLRKFGLDKYFIHATISNTHPLIRKLIKKAKLHKIFKKYYVESSLLYDSEVLNLKGDSYLEGYFQNEMYFQNIRDILIDDFAIRGGVSKNLKKIKHEILNTKVSVSIHIRRGDYISNMHTNSIHGECTFDYYLRSMDFMHKKIGDNIKYFIFSDDMEWVKGNFEVVNAIYVENVELPHEDIYLMSLCSHNIIANSSFSWWGAWLNNNNNKMVVAPKKWFNDVRLLEQSKGIVCDSWVKL